MPRDASNELINELLEIVKSHRKSGERKQSKWEALNKPFAITLLGTVFVTAGTTLWQHLQSKQDRAATYQTQLINERLSVLKKLYSTHFSYFQLQDSHFYLKISYVQEKALDPINQSAAKLSKIRAMAEEHEKQINNSETPYIEAQILQALFPGGPIKEGIGSYNSEFQATMKLINEASLYINQVQGRPTSVQTAHYRDVKINESLTQYFEQRKKLDEALNKLRDDTFRHISNIESQFGFSIKE